MSNSIRHLDLRAIRAKQCQYENRMRRNALRKNDRISKEPTPLVVTKKRNWLLMLIDKILRR